MVQYTEVLLKLESRVVDLAERLSAKSIHELIQELVDKYVSDGRRPMFETKTVAIAWPTDWYAAAMRQWGERNVSNQIRKLIFDAQNSSKNPLPAPPEFRNESAIVKSKHVVPSSTDRNTVIVHCILPLPYYERLLQEHGKGRVSTAIKGLVFHALKKKAPGLSVPRGMQEFL